MSDQLDFSASYQEFIKEICENKIIYSLNDQDGLTVCTSHDYAFEDGSPLRVVCFWHNEELADECKKAEWSKKKIIKLGLTEFMENWCVGLDDDSHLVGINFDEHLFGMEVRPLELLLDIIKYIKTNKLSIQLVENKSIDVLENRAKELLADD
jgi:hypothetical protein